MDDAMGEEENCTPNAGGKRGRSYTSFAKSTPFGRDSREDARRSGKISEGKRAYWSRKFGMR